mmetsp:Transcript_19760/g.47733  ORF Transcript_19760/g.47733 Transcript_19760/m.47733 type:complete len:678 (+) Transcript_19760:436-2469(+)
MIKQPLASIMMTMMTVLMMMIGGSTLSFLSVVEVVDAAATSTTIAGSPPKIDLSSFSNINISSVSSVSSSSASSQSNSNVIEVEMGRMVMQLRSSVDSDTIQLQNEMKLLTTNYLNSYFSSYYKTFAPEPPNNPTTRKQQQQQQQQQQDEDGSGGGDGGGGDGVTVEIETNVGKDAPDSDSNVTTSSDSQTVEEYFSFVNIAVGSFGVHGVDGSFISTLEFAGNVVFRYDPAPSQPFITTLVRNAFQGANEQLFISHLLKSNKLQFLQELTHIIVELDNTAVVETALDDNHNIMEGNGEGSGQQQDGPVVSSSSNSDSQEARSRTSALDWLNAQDRWAEILLYVAAGCIGLVALLCCFSFLRCCCFNPSRSKVVVGGAKHFTANGVVVDDDEPIAVKTVEVPMAKSRGSSSVDPTAIYRKSSSSSSSSKGGYYNRDGWKKTRKSSSSSTTTSSSYRRSTYPAPHYDDSLLDQLERAPPSPDRSISSQDSSMFSYSDNMSACTSSKASVASGTSSRFSIGSTVSRFSMDMPSIDLGAWQSAVRGNTVISATTTNNNVPFGHDISAIGKSDLGIIQEESNDEELVRRNDSRGSNSGSSNEDPDGIHSSSSRRRLSKSSSAYRNKKKGHHSTRRSSINREPKEEFADISLQSDSSDVIADLRNLSIQIKRQAVRQSAVEP